MPLQGIYARQQGGAPLKLRHPRTPLALRRKAHARLGRGSSVPCQMVLEYRAQAQCAPSVTINLSPLLAPLVGIDDISTCPRHRSSPVGRATSRREVSACAPAAHGMDADVADPPSAPLPPDGCATCRLRMRPHVTTPAVPRLYAGGDCNGRVTARWRQERTSWDDFHSPPHGVSFGPFTPATRPHDRVA